MAEGVKKPAVNGFYPEVGLGSTKLFAPEEQDVYSRKLVGYPAPLGAACNWPKHMALLSERRLLTCNGYKHGASPEHFSGQSLLIDDFG